MLYIVGEYKLSCSYCRAGCLRTMPFDGMPRWPNPLCPQANKCLLSAIKPSQVSYWKTTRGSQRKLTYGSKENLIAKSKRRSPRSCLGQSQVFLLALRWLLKPTGHIGHRHCCQRRKRSPLFASSEKKSCSAAQWSLSEYWISDLEPSLWRKRFHC